MLTIKKAKAETYDFKLEGEKKVHKVPLIDNLPMSFFKRASKIKSDDAEALSEFVIDIFDRYAPGVIDELTKEQFEILVEGYFAACETNPGE